MSDEIDHEEGMYDVIEELRTYAELDGTEWGEMLDLCERLWGYSSIMSSELVTALENEMKAALEYAREELEIVETVETFTRKTKRLEQR